MYYLYAHLYQKQILHLWAKFSQRRVLSSESSGLSLLPDHTQASSRLPPRPYKGPKSIPSHSHTIPYLSLLPWTAIPFAIGPAIPSILSFGPPTHLPLARFLAYRYSFPIGQLSPLDSYITSDIFARGWLFFLYGLTLSWSWWWRQRRTHWALNIALVLWHCLHPWLRYVKDRWNV
jgi:hypothetical protein